MRKTINIASVIAVIIAVLNIMIGMSDQLGISETVGNWINFMLLAIVAASNIFSNVKSGEEVENLKQEVKFQKSGFETTEKKELW